jgi:hypothetical protein
MVVTLLLAGKMLSRSMLSWRRSTWTRWKQQQHTSNPVIGRYICCYIVVTCREDAFQEYVELETVYLDTLEAAAAATAAATTTPAEAAAAAVRDAADFGACIGHFASQPLHALACIEAAF